MSNNRLLRQIRRTSELPGPMLACSKIVVCILPIAQIAIGAVYLNDCPRQHYIPIYLIVVGVFGLVLAVLSCLPCSQDRTDGTSNPLNKVCTTWNSLVGLFLFCWFITGQVWVYSIYEPNYIKNSTDVTQYCNKTLYLFAFWTITLIYIMLGLLILSSCCVLFCFFLCGRADPDDDI